jgi:hypothetical protein
MCRLLLCFLVVAALSSSSVIHAAKLSSSGSLLQPSAVADKKKANRSVKLNGAAVGHQSRVAVESVTAAAAAQVKAPRAELPPAVKLLIGAGGIYAAFLYYGTLQEDVFHYTAQDGTKFKGNRS